MSSHWFSTRTSWSVAKEGELIGLLNLVLGGEGLWFFLGAIGMYEGIHFKCSIISLQLPIILTFIFCTVWKYTLITYIFFWNRYRSGIAFFCVQHLCKCFRLEHMILIYNCGWRFYNCLCRICQEVCWLFSTFSLLVSAYCSELICEGIRYTHLQAHPSLFVLVLSVIVFCTCHSSFWEKHQCPDHSYSCFMPIKKL